MLKQSCPTLYRGGATSSQETSDLARHKFNSIEKWLYSEQAGLMSLRDVELGEEIRGRELLRLLLQAHMEARGSGDVGSCIEVFEDGDPATPMLYTHKRIHDRSVVTIFGEICLSRIGYSVRGKTSIHPLDEQLQLPARLYSYEVQRRLVKKAIQGPFDEAIEVLREAMGIAMPKATAEQIVMDAGKDFDSFYQCREGGRGYDSDPIVVGSVDCKGIPMIKSELAVKKVRRGKGEKAQKKKMATVAAVYTQRPRVRTPEDVVASLFDPRQEQDKARTKTFKRQGKRVWASLQAGKDSFIGDVKAEMDRRDIDGQKLRVVVTDGERALQLRVLRTMRGVVLVLDFVHVLEKLWIVGHGLYGEGSKGAVEYVRERALRILRGQASQVVKGIRQSITKRKLKGEKRKKLRNVTDYFYRNRSRMRYDIYLASGLPIASGSVEGACKNLIKDRMERSGMRWSADMAEAMVKTRATYLSGDFEEYWDYHVAQDQQRLYPSARWKATATVVEE